MSIKRIIFSIILAFTAVLTLASCDEQAVEEMVRQIIAEASKNAVIRSDGAIIVQNGESEYSICVEGDSDADVKSAADELSTAIFKRTLTYVPVTDVLGDRAVFINYDSKDNVDIGKHGYSIVEKDGSVYINGADYDARYTAYVAFQENVEALYVDFSALGLDDAQAKDFIDAYRNIREGEADKIKRDGYHDAARAFNATLSGFPAGLIAKATGVKAMNTFDGEAVR